MLSTVIAFSFSLLCLFPLCLHTSAEKERNRYISYTVNYGEGFNLRRDVYMRVVTLVLILRRENRFELDLSATSMASSVPLEIAT